MAEPIDPRSRPIASIVFALLVRLARGSLSIDSSQSQLFGYPLFRTHGLPSALLYFESDVLPRSLIFWPAPWSPRRNLDGNA